MLPIDDFHADGMDFLSNFHPAWIKAWTLNFPTAEHAYVSCKSVRQQERKFIATLPTPGIAKRFGRGKKVQGTLITLRPDFDEKKLRWMEQILERKFMHSHLMAKLQGTGDAEITEGNFWHDNFWGDCGCPKCSIIPGLNHLGRMLMRIRDGSN